GPEYKDSLRSRDRPQDGDRPGYGAGNDYKDSNRDKPQAVEGQLDEDRNQDPDQKNKKENIDDDNNNKDYEDNDPSKDNNNYQSDPQLEDLQDQKNKAEDERDRALLYLLQKELLDYADIERQNEDLKRRLNELENAKDKDKYQDLDKKDNPDIEKENKDLKRKLNDLEDALDRVKDKKDNADIEKENKDLKRKLNDLEDTLDRVKDKKDNTDIEKENKDLKRKLYDLEDALDKVKDNKDNANIEKENKDLKRKLNDLEDILDQVKDKKDNADAENKNLKRKLDELQNAVDRLKDHSPTDKNKDFDGTKDSDYYPQQYRPPADIGKDEGPEIMQITTVTTITNPSQLSQSQRLYGVGQNDEDQVDDNEELGLPDGTVIDDFIDETKYIYLVSAVMKYLDYDRDIFNKAIQLLKSRVNQLPLSVKQQIATPNVFFDLALMLGVETQNRKKRGPGYSVLGNSTRSLAQLQLQPQSQIQQQTQIQVKGKDSIIQIPTTVIQTPLNYLSPITPTRSSQRQPVIAQSQPQGLSTSFVNFFSPNKTKSQSEQDQIDDSQYKRGSQSSLQQYEPPSASSRSQRGQTPPRRLSNTVSGYDPKAAQPRSNSPYRTKQSQS
ncbi:MAG: hypothetical protein EZS28_029993, partial [Streblomastix strix]